MATDDRVARAKPSRRGLLLLLIIASLIYAVTLWPAIMLAMRAPTVSDAGVTIGVFLFTFSAFTLPLALVICTLMAWIAYARRRPAIARIAILLPPLWLILMAMTMLA